MTPSKIKLALATAGFFVCGFMIFMYIGVISVPKPEWIALAIVAVLLNVLRNWVILIGDGVSCRFVLVGQVVVPTALLSSITCFGVGEALRIFLWKKLTGLNSSKLVAIVFKEKRYSVYGLGVLVLAIWSSYYIGWLGTVVLAMLCCFLVFRTRQRDGLAFLLSIVNAAAFAFLIFEIFQEDLPLFLSAVLALLFSVGLPFNGAGLVDLVLFLLERYQTGLQLPSGSWSQVNGIWVTLLAARLLVSAVLMSFFREVDG